MRIGYTRLSYAIQTLAIYDVDAAKQMQTVARAIPTNEETSSNITAEDCLLSLVLQLIRLKKIEGQAKAQDSVPAELSKEYRDILI